MRHEITLKIWWWRIFFFLITLMTLTPVEVQLSLTKNNLERRKKESKFKAENEMKNSLSFINKPLVHTEYCDNTVWNKVWKRSEICFVTITTADFYSNIIANLSDLKHSLL